MEGIKQSIKSKMKNVLDKEKKFKVFEIVLLLFCFRIIGVTDDDEIVDDVIEDVIEEDADATSL